MSAAGPPLTCWRAPGGTLLRQFLTPAEYADVPRDFRAWYDQAPYTDQKGNGQAVYTLNPFYFDKLEKVECRVSPPTPPPVRPPPPRPPPQRPPAPDPPYQPSHSSDWDGGQQWFKDTDSGVMFPYRISESEYKYEYAKYTDRYDDLGGYANANRPPDAEWRYYLLRLGSSSGYSYEEEPRPIYNSLGASGPPGALTRPQEDPRPDELGGVKQYRDSAQGAILPLMISSNDWNGKYSRYQDRYDGMDSAVDETLGIRDLPVPYSRYLLKERLINSGTLTPLPPMARPQYDPREDKITPNSYYYEVEHGAVLPLTVRYEEIEDWGKYRIYQHHYKPTEREPYYGLDCQKMSNGLLEYIGTENTDEAVEEYKRRKAGQKAEVPTYTSSRIKPNRYFKAPDSQLVLPQWLNAYEYEGVRYKNYQDYYVQVNNGHGSLSCSAVFKLQIQKIQDERWTEIVDATDSPSSRGGGDGRERERERTNLDYDPESPVYRASAAPWPSVVDAVFAAHAHAEARRRAAGAAARGERRL